MNMFFKLLRFLFFWGCVFVPPLFLLFLVFAALDFFTPDLFGWFGAALTAAGLFLFVAALSQARQTKAEVLAHQSENELRSLIAPDK